MSDELSMKMGVHQGSVLHEIRSANDLVLMSESMEDLRRKV